MERMTKCIVICVILVFSVQYGEGPFLTGNASAEEPMHANKISAGGWHALGPGLSDGVRAIAISGNDVYVGGHFTDAAGIPEADYIARWDGTNWHALGPGLDAWVSTIAIQGTDVFVGGQFEDAGGNPFGDKIARWDGASWHPLGEGLSWQVRTIVVSTDGNDLYVAGQFTNAGGNDAADKVARWDGTDWHAVFGGFNPWTIGPAPDLLAVDGNDLYIGGTFEDLNGNLDADRIVRWDGSTIHSLGPGLNERIYALAAKPGVLYAAGMFQDAGGDTEADYFVHWSGGAWHATNTTNWTAGATALAIEGNDVYVGGGYQDAGGNPDADRIAKWDGTNWHPLGSGLNADVMAIATDADNVYAGGWFENAGGDPNASRIARWDKSYVSSIQDPDILTPSGYSLSQNYPNPFNSETSIRYTLPELGYVEITIYNASGGKAVTIHDGPHPAGDHIVSWDGRDSSGETSPTGIYICKLVAGPHHKTIRMILMK